MITNTSSASNLIATNPTNNTSQTAAQCFLCRFNLGFTIGGLDSGTFGLLFCCLGLLLLLCCYTLIIYYCCCCCHHLSNAVGEPKYAPVSPTPPVQLDDSQKSAEVKN